MGPPLQTKSMEQKAGKEQTFFLIQLLRAVAALMVVANHIIVLLNERLRVPGAPPLNGAAGVDLFFIISGFVMTISSQRLFGKADGMRTFLARRIERIVPLYWIATTAKILLVLAFPLLAINQIGSPWRVISSYLFLPTFDPRMPHPVLNVGWTLNYEMLFYVFFAVALGLRVPVLRVLVPALGTISILSWMAKPTWPVWLVSYDSMVLEFLFGVLLAKATLAGRIAGRWLSAVLFAGGFVVLMSFSDEHLRVFRFGLTALAIVTGAVGLESTLGKRVPRWVLAIGDASYAIYLVHGFVLPSVGLWMEDRQMLGPHTILVAFVAGMVGSTSMGILVHRYLEVPMMRTLRARRRDVIPVGAK
jgi:peptidoglycan/LPS O-acetylase OafA/YrhL